MFNYIKAELLGELVIIRWYHGKCRNIHMQKHTQDVPNQETLEAIEEVQRLKNNPAKKTYDSFNEILKEAEIE